MTSARTDVTQLAIFELHLTVVDHPTDRRRWNGGPMPSEDTDLAVHEATEAYRKVIAEHGFEIVRTGYGVAAMEADDAS